MSLEEDNSPFATAEDEFTDLPLQDDEPVAKEPVSEEPEQPAEPQETQQPEQQLGTQAYDPEMYVPVQNNSSTLSPDTVIEIVDAGKSREGNTRGYIVYTIRCEGKNVRRRYSEFELLRNALLRLLPTRIIPPIPEKHKITKYAAQPTKAKEDVGIIEHRRRMLAVFLKRCLAIDAVRESSVFLDFLDPNSNWSEVLQSPPLSDIPKEILKADPMDPAHSSAAHSYLPIPASSVIYVKQTEEDQKFAKVQDDAREYESVISGGIEKVNKRLVKHFAELGSEFSEAGAAFNGFSLQESSALASTLEKFGQVNDNCYLSTEQTVKTLNYEFTEPLGESAQFASVVKEVIKFRQQKSMQLDITARSLKHRLNYLKLLQKAEEESQRIQQALEAGEAKTGQINFDRKAAREAEQQKLQAELDAAAKGENIIPLEPKKSGMFKIPGMSKITNLISTSIEPEDPDQKRQGNMQKTKEDINQLKQTYIAAERDLKRVTESINGELERFSKQRDEELKKMLRSYATAVLDWSRNNLEFWEEAKAEAAKDV